MKNYEVRIVAMHWPKRSQLSIDDRLILCDDRVSLLKPGSIDVVCFPESFLYKGLTITHISEVEKEYFPAVTHAKHWAKHLRSNIMLPIIHGQHGRYTNSVLIISRTGSVIGHYEKRYPWPSNLDKPELEDGISPGSGGGGVIDMDFGRIGVQTCFDVNWTRGWDELHRKRVSLVLFPSEYPGGFALRARAWQTRAPIVAVILGMSSRIVDMTGAEITRKCSKSDDNMSVITLNTNRALIHLDHNEKAVQRLQHQHSIKLKRLPYDNVFLLEAPCFGDSIDKLLEECGVRQLDAYLRESLKIIKTKRNLPVYKEDLPQQQNNLVS